MSTIKHHLLEDLCCYLNDAETLLAEKRHLDLGLLSPKVDDMVARIQNLDAEEAELLAAPLDALIMQLEKLQKSIQSEQRGLLEEVKKIQHLKQSNRSYRNRQGGEDAV